MNATVATFSSDEVEQHRAEWVAALRSSVYQQTFGRLRRAIDPVELGKTGYCCLGVAEDIRGCRWEGHGGRTYYLVSNLADVPDGQVLVPTGTDTRRVVAHLTSEGAHWLGLTTTDPYVAWSPVGSDTFRVSSLVDLNDEHRLSFEEIAQVIDDMPTSWRGTDASARKICDEWNRRLNVVREIL